MIEAASKEAKRIAESTARKAKIDELLSPLSKDKRD